MSKAYDSANELEFINYDASNNRINFTVNIASNNAPIADESAGAYANAAFIKANSAFSAANSGVGSIQYGANTTTNTFFSLPFGSTAERPVSAQLGAIRYNTSNNFIEVYTNEGWSSIGLLYPTITNVSPSTFNGESGTYFTITGGGFLSGAIATFITSTLDEYPANTTTFLNSNQLLAISPRNFTVSDEPLSIRVTNPNGASVVSSNTVDCGGSPTFQTASGSLGLIYDSMRLTSDYSSILSTISASDTEQSNLTYSLVSGSLPTGMSLNSNTAQLSGNVQSVGSDTTYTFTIRASDGVNNTSRQFSITVKAPITETFTVAGSTTWTPPTNLTKLTRLIMIGGGGGGSSGNGQWAAGGGGGGFVNVINVPVNSSNTYSFVVGSLGAGATSCGANGNDGGNTTAFTNIAYGGSPGVVGPLAGIGGSFLIPVGTNSGSSSGSNGNASTGDGSGGGGTNGGGSTYGVGAAGVPNGIAGNHATGYGNGGGGGHSCQGGHRGGGNGSAGYIELRY